MDDYQHEIKNDKLTISQIMTELTRECWVFESWSEHPQGDVYYTVKLTCGVQARGRYEADGQTFEKALRKVYNIVMNKWGKNE